MSLIRMSRHSHVGDSTSLKMIRGGGVCYIGISVMEDLRREGLTMSHSELDQEVCDGRVGVGRHRPGQGDTPTLDFECLQVEW